MSEQLYRNRIMIYRASLDVERTRLQRELDSEDLKPSERSKLRHTQAGIDYAIERFTHNFPKETEDFRPELLRPDTPLSSVGMSRRARNFLSKITKSEYFKRDGYVLETLNDLAQLGVFHLSSCIGGGPVTITELRSILNSAGLDYKEYVDADSNS